MSIASDRARSECVEETQFPELSQRYQVRVTTKIVINDRVEFEGAIPERDFVNAVLQAVNGEAPTEAGETREP